ncbi:MAG: hypothetical protein ACM3ML_19980 [Micromonosporaceae bacterium]
MTDNPVNWADESSSDLVPPDLGPLRAMAERTELAEAVSVLADANGYRLPEDHPLAPLARELARSLTEAGFTLHHCMRHDPLYRLGGVCLLPIPADDGQNGGGVVVSWTTHDLLLLDWARYGTYRGVQDVMNEALADVLRALGYEVRPFGSGGASLVTGRRARDAGVAQ